VICGKTSSFPRALFRVAASVKISLISPPTLAPILDLRPFALICGKNFFFLASPQ
jgi:hypothetical protein